MNCTKVLLSNEGTNGMMITQQIAGVYNSILNLIYPNLCQGCDEYLLPHENHICTKCLYEIPRTNFHTLEDNPVARLFWGRVQIERATAFFRFNKGGVFQRLIHKLKYQGKKDLGIELGRQFGYDLSREVSFRSVDIIVPVPLHSSREKKRGYNQSQLIAEGIALSLGKPVDSSSLIRVENNQTQTNKTRFERYENVKSIFQVLEGNNLNNKHILLVDDVITTGSTLEACANQLLSLENIKVSIATLAVA